MKKTLKTLVCKNSLFTSIVHLPDGRKSIILSRNGRAKIDVKDARRLAKFLNKQADILAKHNYKFNWRLQGAKPKKPKVDKQMSFQDVYNPEGGVNNEQ